MLISTAMTSRFLGLPTISATGLIGCGSNMPSASTVVLLNHVPIGSAEIALVEIGRSILEQRDSKLPNCESHAATASQHATRNRQCFVKANA